MGDSSPETIKRHNTVVLVLTISAIGCSIENITQGWESWVLPIVALGVLACWWMHVSQRWNSKSRENFYIVFSMLLAFFHGVHEISFFDTVVVTALLMATVVVVKRTDYMRLILAEYYLIMIIHIVDSLIDKRVEYNSLTMARLSLQFVTISCLYVVLKKVIKESLEKEEELERCYEDKRNYDHNMEDFLVNISHELRTPVNVINGLSDLILRKENRDDVRSIQNAGIRMARQIEDIQDYSEVQRNAMLLEMDKYAITSITNDILTIYRAMDMRKELEFIVDLDPNVPAIMRGDGKKIRKIIEHLLDNAFKFTKRGGVVLKIMAFKKADGVNLEIEVTDTGKGMTQKDIDAVSKGSYQADRKRTRSTGGIGLGLSIVYGMVRKMDGFVKIDSVVRQGTTVRVTIFQEVVDPQPCLRIPGDKKLNVVFYYTSGKVRNLTLARSYSDMVTRFATGLDVNLSVVGSVDELKEYVSEKNVTHIFMGVEEYEANPAFIDYLASKKITVALSTNSRVIPEKYKNALVMRSPIYGLQLARVLSDERDAGDIPVEIGLKKPDLKGIKALVVDDEPMNLVVAKGLFREYQMEIDTAESGRQALEKYGKNDYDVIFMDHMMPEMDGIEAMKRLREIAEQGGRSVKIVALTANAVSGAKEMFLREGFDGFIAKPINIADFDSVMNKVMAKVKAGQKGGAE